MTGRRPLRVAPPAVGWAVAAALPLAFLGVFFAWPVAALVARGFVAEAGGLDLTGLRDVLGAPRTWRLLGTTLAQAAAGSAGSVVLGLPVTYLLYRTRFPGRTLLRGLVTVPFVLPTVVVGVAFRALFRPDGLLGFAHLDETFAGVVLALVFFNVSVVVRTVGGLWERLDPRAEQAARALGASPARAFRTVTLPALAPAIASAAAVVFLFCATAFGVVLVLGGAGYGTIETEIYRRTTQFLDLRTAAVLSILQLVVVSAALWAAGRARARREHALHLEHEDVAAHRWSVRSLPDVAAAVATALVVGGLMVTPLAGLVVRSLRHGDGSWTLDNYLALGTTGGRNALVVTVWQALATSLRTALVATAIAVVVGGLVALVVSRRPRGSGARRAVGALDAVVMLPLGVSAVTVGFGFLITLDRPLGLDVDLRTSGLLVPIAQAVVAIPLVVRTVLPVLRAIDPRLREAAAVLGAAPGRVLRDVDLPIALRSLGLAIGFAFAVSLGEFGATAFLARPDSATLPVVIFRLIGRPGAQNYGMALAASVVLAALTAAVMMLAERLRGDRAAGAVGGEF
ncbi:ABC transporter permease [Xylanimonas ulmi]|uniref:Thiamine transport system permease protein n=1 Tax=Xylanimonas ulmi TaxID=228973 RepID=A0A4Q7M4A9_9MICO|nr:iron ABC transporter permease [Xylanibacterium ulmi]RZS62795.1 thiamine transport system permease protein [Xylanibacterium ulmi]